MSGRPDYDAGDLVVCVDTTSESRLIAATEMLSMGQIYRVAGIAWSPMTMTWDAILDGVCPERSDTGGFLASRFRRIDPKPPEFWTGTVSADANEQVPA